MESEPAEIRELPDIEKEVVVDTTPEKAFQALVDPEALRKWWLLSADAEVEFEPRVGGKFRARKPGAWSCENTIEVFEPPRHLAYSWDVSWAKSKTRVDFYVDDLGNGRVRVRVIHSGWKTDATGRAEHDKGWSGIFLQLGEYLEGRAVQVRVPI
jgi:uncharacterized protein YndB with AHSA1/START domain